MPTVLIVQRDLGFAHALATRIEAAGYRPVICPGALWAGAQPVQCNPETCPLTRMADLMIYAPDVVRYDADGKQQCVAAESAHAHPYVPLLLAWPGAQEPSGVAAVMAQAPGALRAASLGPDPFTGIGLEDQVRWLAGPTKPPALPSR